MSEKTTKTKVSRSKSVVAVAAVPAASLTDVVAKPKKASKKAKMTLNDLSELSTIGMTEMEALNEASGAALPVEDLQAILQTPVPPVPVSKEDEDFMYVTSLNLRRSKLKGRLKHVKCVFQEDIFRKLVAAGIQNGVTWDEVVRAIVDRELSGLAPFAGIENYMKQPA